MKIEQLMTSPVETCFPSDTLNRAAQLMWEHDCGAIPVIDGDGKPIAMITDRDICMASYTQGRSLDAAQVASAMSKSVVSCAENDSVATAEAMMQQHQIRRLPVVDSDGKIVGILSLNDIAAHGHLEKKKKTGARHDSLGADAIATTLSAICSRSGATAAAE